MPDLLFATTNAHKTAEVAAILGPEWTLKNLADFPELPSPEETGETFPENARIKALSASQVLPGLLVLADDSGLEVDALHGAPGVRSARYAGPDATDADNRARLKTELGKLPGAATLPPFPARFRCSIALARDGQILCEHDGAVEGVIQLEETGAGGFGYDALFVPEGHHESFGVLPAETKNQLSHRARALSRLKSWLAGNPV
jgi:XTP/dITP diphosphohydrolase